MGAKLIDKAIHVRMNYSHTALPRLLLILIADAANDETRIAKISTYELKRLTGFEIETLDETLRNLESQDLIETIDEVGYYLRFYGEKYDAINIKNTNHDGEGEPFTYTPRWIPHHSAATFYQEDLDILMKNKYFNKKLDTDVAILLPKPDDFTPDIYDKETTVSNLQKLSKIFSIKSAHGFNYQETDIDIDFIKNTIERVESSSPYTLLDCYLLGLSTEVPYTQKSFLTVLFNSLLNEIVALAVTVDVALKGHPHWENGRAQKYVESFLSYKIKSYSNERRPFNIKKDDEGAPSHL